MDIVSIAFSTFLNSITDATHEHLNNQLGLEIQSKVVEYHNHKIAYQYQLWQIKNETVCLNYQMNLINQYSSCTLAAQEMFVDTCQYLQQQKISNWRHKKLKNMYCSAAVNYQPTVASISTPDEQEAKVWDAKQKCSLLTLESSNGSKTTEKARKEACAEYKKLLKN